MGHAFCIWPDSQSLTIIDAAHRIIWYSYMFLGGMVVLYCAGYTRFRGGVTLAMTACFALFILACGQGHFYARHTLWSGNYSIEAAVLAIVAAISGFTALAGAYYYEWTPKALGRHHLTYWHPVRYLMPALAVGLSFQEYGLQMSRQVFCTMTGICG